MVLASKPLMDGFWFGPQNLVGISVGTIGGLWCHREASFEAKQSGEEPMLIGFTDLELDHFTPWLTSSSKISKGIVGSICNRSINKRIPVPN